MGKFKKAFRTYGWNTITIISTFPSAHKGKDSYLTANSKFRLNGFQFRDIERRLFMENDLRTANRKVRVFSGWLLLNTQ